MVMKVGKLSKLSKITNRETTSQSSGETFIGPVAAK